MFRMAIGLVLLTVAQASSVSAQAIAPPCAERSAIIERLSLKWGESFAGGGLQSETSVFEVWMSEEKGTWTILKTSADGMSCVMATGTNWRNVSPEAQPAGIRG